MKTSDVRQFVGVARVCLLLTAVGHSGACSSEDKATLDAPLQPAAGSGVYMAVGTPPPSAMEPGGRTMMGVGPEPIAGGPGPAGPPMMGGPQMPPGVEPPGVGSPDGDGPDPEPEPAPEQEPEPVPEQEPEAVACDPADRGPEASVLTGLGTGAAPSGTFDVVVESDPGISDQTVFRPEPLGMIKHPVLAWGNGGCMKRNSGFAEFLIQLAAEGILVIADGSPGGSGSSSDDGSQLIKAIDWAEKENQRPCSKYYQSLDLTKVAVAGQSCGGLMALNASDDPRVTTSMPMNSGLFTRDRALYSALHAPMAIINGGPSDIAYANGNADFEAIDTIPILLANIPVGHGGTYREDNGGEMGRLAIAWLRWHLLQDDGATGKGMFIGDGCGLCSSEWDLQWKMKPQ